VLLASSRWDTSDCEGIFLADDAIDPIIMRLMFLAKPPHLIVLGDDVGDSDERGDDNASGASGCTNARVELGMSLEDARNDAFPFLSAIALSV
jgi:hypothetical protein